MDDWLRTIVMQLLPESATARSSVLSLLGRVCRYHRSVGLGLRYG